MFTLFWFLFFIFLAVNKPRAVGLGCWIHWLHLCRWGVRSSPNECPEYDIKKSDGEAPVMLEVWVMWSTLSLLLFPNPHCPGVVAPDRVLSMGKKNCLTFKLRANKWLLPNWIEIELFDHLTVFKCVYNSYIFMEKQDLALNNQQRLICHKTKLNQTNKR